MKSNTKIYKLPYRKNVSCILFKGNNYLLVQLADWKKNWWKFPQGGVEEGEKIEETIERELDEELGISEFKIIAKSKNTNLYDWPDDIIIKTGFKWRGQDQVFYIVEYLGDKSSVKILDPKEVRKYQWVTKNELFKVIDHEDKIFSGYKKIIENVFEEFGVTLH